MPKFQLIRVTLNTPKGERQAEFIGKALWTDDEFKAIADQPTGELITNFSLSPPFDLEDVPGDFDELREEIS